MSKVTSDDRLKLTSGKKESLAKLATEKGIINALAIDQRGALKKMLIDAGGKATDTQIETFKRLVAEELTPHASAILLDPEYGLPAAKARAKNAGLLLAYEKTGYDMSTPGRLPDLLADWSIQRLKANGADAIKLLLYYDIAEDEQINHLKHIFTERIGSECAAEDLPFYLELISYDTHMASTSSRKYAAVKPKKVTKMMQEFSKSQYKVDVLKVEVPVNMHFVAGFSTEEPVYTQAEAMNYFKEQSAATHLPFIFLSAGVSPQMFQETLRFAKAAGSTFNGVLCGRATWRNGVQAFVEGGETAARAWLKSEGTANITTLNDTVNQTASPWYNKAMLTN